MEVTLSSGATWEKSTPRVHKDALFQQWTNMLKYIQWTKRKISKKCLRRKYLTTYAWRKYSRSNIFGGNIWSHMFCENIRSNVYGENIIGQIFLTQILLIKYFRQKHLINNISARNISSQYSRHKCFVDIFVIDMLSITYPT